MRLISKKYCFGESDSVTVNESNIPYGRKRRTYISLFSSAGVGCYGFKQNGFDCIATNELLPLRMEVQKANGKCKYDDGYIIGDLTTKEVKEAINRELEYWRIFEKINDVDVIFATPPCQGMSTANYKKKEDEQVRNSLVVEAIKVIKDIKPKIFIFENVRAFLTTVCTDVSGVDMPIRSSILSNLGEEYHIYAKVINFKDYGVPSSRPRTIVIGTRRDILNISPLNLFPVRQPEITLREAIGNLPPLSFGERDGSDYLHFARPFPEYMLSWIENISEGQSAFNQEESRRPFKYGKDDTKIPLKGSYMGNKYRRLFWDKPCACIATRNDQLASQDTIHPCDNRVLSIRELMRVMTIPDSFLWSKNDNHITPKNSASYLKTHELNIRRCIGEAVPTNIIFQVANNINLLLDFEDFVSSYYEGRNNDAISPETYISNYYIYTFLKEQALEDIKSSGAFYTPQAVVFDAIKDLDPNIPNVSILEPSVGLGAFLPQVCSLYSNSDSINIDAVEINPESISDFSKALESINLGSNVNITTICSDFLKFTPTRRYDVVVTNPPYAKATEKYSELKNGEHKTSNLFALFMIKFRNYAKDIVCVIPKNFILADDYASIRYLYKDFPIVSITDFGVNYFKKVFVEIIAIHFSKGYTKNVEVVNYLLKKHFSQPQGYIIHDRLWLLYRDEWFDSFIESLQLDVFDFFRDRQITNGMIKDYGNIWVIRSKNILDDGSIVHKPGYDKFIDNLNALNVGRFFGSKSIIMPSFTYNTRASILPDGCIPNGSIAILTPKRKIEIKDLNFYATKAFRHYYAIVKSYSKFTLNIDKSSVYYIGVPYGF